MTADSPPATAPGDARRVTLWAALPVVAWLAFALWTGGNLVYAATDARALGGDAIMLWIGATFALIQTRKLFRLMTGRPRLRWLGHLLGVLFCILLGYLISLWAIQFMYARHDRLIMEQLAPLVGALEAGHDDLRISDPLLARSLIVLRGAGGFLLTVPGASLDIDGATVFYDSEIKRLLRFSSDLREHPNTLRFERRSREMTRIYPRP